MFSSLSVSIVAASLLTCTNSGNLKMTYSYPATRTDDVVDTLHGQRVTDPYRWLENAASPEVRAWVDKQNAFSRSVLDQLPDRQAIHARLSQLLDISVLGTPQPAGGHYFYTRRDGKQNQPILYVREGVNGKDRALVDPNAEAADGTVALDWWYPSLDGSLVAFGLSKNGSEQSTLYIARTATGERLKDTIERTRYCSLAWLPDASGFYYTRYPAKGSVPAGEENYHHHVYFHQVGSATSQDQKVFGEGRAAEDMPSVQLSPDGRWLVVTEHQGWAKSEIYFRDRSTKSPSWQTLVEKVPAIFEPIVCRDHFLIRTNEKAPRYKLYQVDPMKPARDHWVEVIPEGDEVLEAVASVSDDLVTISMRDASSRLRVLDGHGKLTKQIELPTLGTVAAIGSEWNGHEFFYGFQSFTVPQTIYRVELGNLQGELWRKVDAEINFASYEVNQVRFPSKDGTAITMFLAHKKGIGRDGRTPTLLYGYGGFNISLTPSFNASRFLFLERGGLLAIPNLRGGGEYGEAWHQGGMLAKKQNVFDDFISAAEWLIQERYTSSSHLVIQGGSNGGLLVGAALTQRPDLFKAVVCQVPLLDMLRYHKFLIARLWIPEYGSADDAAQFKWLAAYSPYHHVQSGTAYPAVLLETAESDSRVDALHARKMAARLQAANGSEGPILLRLETKAGHGQGKPRAKVLDELTDTWSFVFWQLGLDSKS
jgi:prolyl oligopeptidase